MNIFEKGKLIKFITELGIANRYYGNLMERGKCFETFLKRNDIRNAFLNAFIWGNTVEGFWFWHNVTKLWYKYLEGKTTMEKIISELMHEHSHVFSKIEKQS